MGFFIAVFVLTAERPGINSVGKTGVLGITFIRGSFIQCTYRSYSSIDAFCDLFLIWTDSFYLYKLLWKAKQYEKVKLL